MLREDALGVELHSFDIVFTVAHTHDGAVFCARSDGE
jgi:hypothetical protein